MGPWSDRKSAFIRRDIKGLSPSLPPLSPSLSFPLSLSPSVCVCVCMCVCVSLSTLSKGHVSTARRHLSTSWKDSSHHKSDWPKTCSRTCQPPELWENMFLLFVAPCLIFCYCSPPGMVAPRNYMLALGGLLGTQGWALDQKIRHETDLGSSPRPTHYCWVILAIS